MSAIPVLDQPIGDHVIETVGGRRVDLLRPAPMQIDMGDIAWGLSRIARFVGQTKHEHFYSVAEHSLWVSIYLYRTTGDAEISLYGLLHDAHEAYTGDIPQPVKSLPVVHDEITRMQARIQAAIYQALELPAPPSDVADLIHESDRIALAVEARALMHSGGADWPLPPIPDIAQQIRLRSPILPFISGRAFAGRFYLLYKAVRGELQ